MDNQRLFLFIALGLVVMMLWQSWQEQYAPNQSEPSVEKSVGAEKEKKSETVPVTPETQTAKGLPATTQTGEKLKRGKRIHVLTDLLDVKVDLAGGDIRDLRFVQHPVELDKPDHPFIFLADSADSLHVAQSGLIGPGKHYPNHESTVYRTSGTKFVMGEGQDTLRVPLIWKAPDGTAYTKTYVFHRGRYVIDVEYEIHNRTSKTWQGHQYAQFRQRFVDSDSSYIALPTFVGGVVYGQKNQYEKISFDDMRETPLKQDQVGGWAAMMQHYFIGAWLPEQDKRQRLYTKALDDDTFIIGYISLERNTVEPGKKGKMVTQAYIGPKETKRLKTLPEGMNLTVDYGWLTFLSAPLYWVLAALNDWFGNWGWAIVVLTILIKLVFFPLSAASYKSMARMKKVQPRIQALKEKYGDDRTRMNQAMMEIYKTEKINPLGGCLPILIQIPVFIALYWVLLESVEMRQAPFALWIKDLSAKDPYYVLPLIMGASMFAQHKLNPTPMDPMQQRIMLALPAVFTIFFLFFPSGLVLYWVVNNLLSIAQQWQINRMIKA